MNLLGLHHLARNGDGLIDPFLQLAQHRRAIEMDPRIVELRYYNMAIPDVAGHPIFTQPIATSRSDGMVPPAKTSNGP